MNVCCQNQSSLLILRRRVSRRLENVNLHTILYFRAIRAQNISRRHFTSHTVSPLGQVRECARWRDRSPYFELFPHYRPQSLSNGKKKAKRDPYLNSYPSLSALGLHNPELRKQSHFIGNNGVSSMGHYSSKVSCLSSVIIRASGE